MICCEWSVLCLDVKSPETVTQVCFLFAPQDTFAKAMMPMYEFVNICRLAAVQMVQSMERAMPAARLSAYSFKQLETIRDPEDFHSIVREMGDESQKPTAVCFVAVTAKIIRNLWWTWLLQHPLLSDDEIHPSKRMHCCWSLSVWIECLCLVLNGMCAITSRGEGCLRPICMMLNESA